MLVTPPEDGTNMNDVSYPGCVWFTDSDAGECIFVIIVNVFILKIGDVLFRISNLKSVKLNVQKSALRNVTTVGDKTSRSERLDHTIVSIP